MSWSLQVPHGFNGHTGEGAGVPVADFESAAKESLAKSEEGVKKTNPDGWESANLATLAAIELVSSGIVGEGKVVAYLSGHGNPNHEAPPGWSKDMVTITLHRMDK